MRAMRTLLGLAVLLFAAWSAWWWYGSSHQKQAIEDWLQDRREAGWQAETEDLTVTGYPNRFDMIAEGLTLADPASGWAWTAPEFRTYMLSYQPNRVIASWPGIHRFAVPGEQVELTAEQLRASAAFAPDPGLALDHGVLEARELSLGSSLGWTAFLDRGQLALRDSEVERGRANAYDAVLEVEGFRPPAPWRELLGDRMADSLPEAFDRVLIDVTAAFPRPLDAEALESGNLRPETLWLRKSTISWGDLGLEGSGRLDVAPDGTPTGEIALKAEDWRQLLRAAVSAGAVPGNLEGALEAGLGLMSTLTSDGRSLEAPLVFRNGRMSLGPIPLGEAPRF